MLFNSYFFIFVFLPITVLVYHAINKFGKYQISQYFLLFMSICFYGYADINCLPVLAGSICLNYLMFLLLKKCALPAGGYSHAQSL